MPRRSPTVPISSGDGADPDVTAIEANWPRIEKAYGKALLADVRSELLKATKTFLKFELPERTAEPRKNTVKWIKDYKKVAEELLRAMLPSPRGASDANRFAQLLVIKNFPQGTKGFYTLVSLLHSLNAASVSALDELPSMPSFRKGRQWGRWIRQLTKIIRNNSLPDGASKDGLSTSPFVDLVWEMQQFLPVACRRHTQSKAALAKAIWVERDRPKRQAAKEAKATHRE